MHNNIGLQIAGSAPGFTVLYSIGWSGDDLAHSSVRRESVQPVYYEACFGSEYWTYVLVLCNFLSNVNREESFKIGIRFPARHCIVNAEGTPVSPAVVLGRILDSVKTTALTRRGTETYRLRPDAQFPSADYEAILADYHLREIWGPVTECAEDKPDIFFELRGYNPEQPLLRLPHMASASGASKVYLGSFTENVDKLLFSPVEMAAAPLVNVKIEGKDRFYDYCILPGHVAELSSTNYGYPQEAFEQAVVRLDYDDIINTSGKCLDNVRGDGFEVFYNINLGIVKVCFAPKSRKLTYPVRIVGEGVDPTAVAASIYFKDRAIDDLQLTLCGLGIPAFMQAVQTDSAYLLKNFRLSSDLPRSLKSARFDGEAIVLELVGSKRAGSSAGTVLLVRSPRPLVGSKEVRVKIFPDSEPSAGLREYVFPAVAFEAGDGAWFARLRIGNVAEGEHIVVYIDNPASAECMAFANEKGVYMADFGSSGRSRSLPERIVDVFGLSADRRIPAVWKALRWLIVAAVALMLLLGGVVGGFYASSALDGNLPFIQKMK